jgi:hypothetical protein
MEPRLAPRHIIPTICYAILFIAAALVAAIIYANLQSLEIPGAPTDETIPLLGVMAVGIAVAAVLLAFGFAIVAAVLPLFPLVLSSINIAKRNRKLAIACLVFDALLVEFFALMLFSAIFSTFSSADTFVLPLAYATGLGLCALSLVMNILNIKRNILTQTIPTEDIEPLD